MKRDILALILMSSVLSACASDVEEAQIPIQPVPQPMAYQEPPTTYYNHGSIFSSGNARHLYEDNRARKVGDIVMVNIMETSSGSSTANTETTKDSMQQVNITEFFGLTEIPLLGIPIGGAVPLFETSSEKEFNGSGTTSRENVVTATIAARVLNVMPDGLMHIEGVREVKVNNEVQYVMVSGLVRAQDISSSNSISSNQIANAKIEIYGKGIIAEPQSPSGLARVLDKASPF